MDVLQLFVAYVVVVDNRVFAPVKKLSFVDRWRGTVSKCGKPGGVREPRFLTTGNAGQRKACDWRALISLSEIPNLE